LRRSSRGKKIAEIWGKKIAEIWGKKIAEIFKGNKKLRRSSRGIKIAEIFKGEIKNCGDPRREKKKIVPSFPAMLSKIFLKYKSIYKLSQTFSGTTWRLHTGQEKFRELRVI
jgi:hypothetical protein